MNLIEAGKAFIKAFPTRARWQQYCEWEERQRREMLRQRKIAQQTRKRRREIEKMSDDIGDDDYEPMAPEIWEEIAGRK